MTCSTSAATCRCLARAADRLRLTDVPVARLEVEVEAMNAALPKLDQLHSSGRQRGCRSCARCACTSARRAERELVRLAAEEKVSPALIRYLNRLSDHLFVLARVFNGNGADDILWVPGGNRGE